MNNEFNGWNEEGGLTEEELQAFIDESIDDELLAAIDKDIERYFDNQELYDAMTDSLTELKNWVCDRGLAAGEYQYYLEDGDYNFFGSLDLAWPFGIRGLQGGFSKPVAVNIFDTTPELLEAAEEFGFTVFTNVEEFREYVEKNYPCR